MAVPEGLTRQLLPHLWRLVKGLPLVVLSPFLLLAAALSLFLSDLFSKVRRHRPLPEDRKPCTKAASIVIPNWNGRDLLGKYLPSVISSIEAYPAGEVIVIDNGSTDGSAEFIRLNFPQVRLIALEKNLGFGGGSNAGFREARNDVVVLLNSDMRVDRGFLGPLLAGFTDEKVFAVACQIFFSDPNSRREETGLTEGWWQQGSLRVRHRIDAAIQTPYPSFYGGGGSCAFDRRKFLELGGFDELLAPFYLEDTDLGYLAWKRGWKVLYQPASIVYHEHRGTIGKHFSDGYIQSVLKTNFLLFVWKNIHEWRRLAAHFFFAWAGAVLSWVFGDSPERASFSGIGRGLLRLPRALVSRARARALATISDTEAFRRPLGGHFRDTFANMDDDRLRVLFVSPYPICPTVHGGGVFMYQTLRELARLCELHLIVLLDYPQERDAHGELDRICASTEYVVRLEGRQKAIGSIVPHAVREFRNPDLAWLIHRQIYTRCIDVVQLEYTVMGQYAGQFRRIPSILFEHDIYFQSIARRLPFLNNFVEKMEARWEYLRSLRYELRLLPKPDRIQVCSPENGAYLTSFLPALKGRIDDSYRAGIDSSLYEFHSGRREPFTMLFLGSFRHLPNQEALQWFVGNVFPRVRAQEPRARLIVIGSDPPPRHWLPVAEGIDLVGFVQDVREPLSRYAVFVCPILSGSGVRVKLLEAFASGIPVVSTRLGAEGLVAEDGRICALADQPSAFADRIIELFRNPEQAAAMAQRARAEVVARRDMRGMTERLVESYREEIRRLRDRSQKYAMAAKG
ncbi:MAG: glycosyl transferase [Acidobacteria bacterium]|nr:MAG: glycosyl transferase [Acidobacteriota bacterium]